MFSLANLRNLGMWVSALKVYKVVTKVTRGPWLKEETLPQTRRYDKLHSTIHAVLLSEFVSQNTWLYHLVHWLGNSSL